MTSIAPRNTAISAGTSIPTYYRMLLRGQLTRGRIAGLGVLAGLSVLLAAVSRRASALDREDAAVELLASYSIGLLVPLACLLLATPMLGNLVEDRLLVYLWLKPVPRWHLAVAAFAAVVSVLLPVVVIPVALSAAVTGFGGLLLPAVLASALGVLAYSAINLLLGARFTGGLWFGLLYLVLWENVLSRLSDGMARLSLRSYLLSILEDGTSITVPLADRAGWASIVVPLVIAAVAVALTALTLAKQDVD